MKNFHQLNNSTCPWWLLFTFDNPLRRLVHDPDRLLKPYIQDGDTVLDVGCGMGYFTLALARLAGSNGKVIAADLQPEMLTGLQRRARRAGLAERIQLVQSTPNQIKVPSSLDFALAFWMVHEVRQPGPFFAEIFNALRPGANLLVVEPLIHVSKRAFERSLLTAQNAGFSISAYPSVRFSRAALLAKK